MTDHDQETILTEVRAALVELFDVDPLRVVPEAHLFDDLGLDSIDAIDLVVRLQQATGKKLSPEQFKSVRTVGDMLGILQQLLAEVG